MRLRPISTRVCLRHSYAPPTATITATVADGGSQDDATPIVFTATYSTPVTMVEADFGFTSTAGSAGNGYTVSFVNSVDGGLTYELTVTPAATFVATDFAVDVAAGATSPPSQASGAYTVRCVSGATAWQLMWACHVAQWFVCWGCMCMLGLTCQCRSSPPLTPTMCACIPRSRSHVCPLHHSAVPYHQLCAADGDVDYHGR